MSNNKSCAQILRTRRHFWRRIERGCHRAGWSRGSWGERIISDLGRTSWGPRLACWPGSWLILREYHMAINDCKDNFYIKSYSPVGWETSFCTLQRFFFATLQRGPNFLLIWSQLLILARPRSLLRSTFIISSPNLFIVSHGPCYFILRFYNSFMMFLLFFILVPSAT